MSNFYVFAKNTPEAAQTISSDCRRLQNIKRLQISDALDADWASASVLRYPDRDTGIAKTPDGIWLCSAGTWVHKGGIPSSDASALLRRYIAVGAEQLAMELEGVFAVAIGDPRTRTVAIITDPMGSLHVYTRITPAGIACCTSSMALSECGELDRIGAHEFVACGIVYEDRSLWSGIKKLPPASITRISDGAVSTSAYWKLADALPPGLRLNEAGDALMANLTASLKLIGSNFDRIVADLTGGYDSRLLLCALLESGMQFDNTVAGPPESADVLTAKAISRQLGTTLKHFEDQGEPSVASFHEAIRLSDGEYNAFDYTRILASQAPLAANYEASLNGSFGEVARGYWWELLWPHLEHGGPLDAEMVARKRFAAIPYTNVFANAPFESLVQHMTGVVARTAAPYAALPPASQMDCVYLTMRMQRWQGRIASNTNQLWPSISPIGFSNVISPILSARPRTRLRSLLPRHIFATRNRTLANIPLEHGYPPAPANLLNLARFTPIVGHYAGKVVAKIKARLPRKPSQSLPLPPLHEKYAHLFDEPLFTTLRQPVILETGLFDEDKTRDFLNPARPLSGHKLEQWQRLVSLECSLRALKTAAHAA